MSLLIYLFSLVCQVLSALSSIACYAVIILAFIHAKEVNLSSGPVSCAYCFPIVFYRLETGAPARVKPFGIEIRNVKCLRCGNFGHQSGDRECPLKDVIMPNEESRLKRDDPLTAILAHTDPNEVRINFIGCVGIIQKLLTFPFLDYQLCKSHLARNIVVLINIVRCFCFCFIYLFWAFSLTGQILCKIISNFSEIWLLNNLK